MTVQELYQAIGGDYADATKRLMNDSLIGRFITKFPADGSFDKLTAAVQAGDAAAIFEAAHTLKGVAANLAVTSIAEIAGEITEATRGGDLQAGFPLPEKMAALTACYTQAVDAINRFAAQG